MIGATYSTEHYSEFQRNRDKNYFEEIIDMMILQEVAGFNESFRRAVQNLPRDKQRMAILSKLDKDRNLFLSIKGLLDSNVNKFEHIKDVILMLRQYVKVGEVEKKKFGEVMTPLDLVKEMLSKLPIEVWSNPNLKWLDPANGTGPFPAMVIYKLMEGLKEWEPDEEKRYKHIVENMIYVCELQPKNMFLWLCAIDPWDKYKLNIYTGSFLDEGFDKHMKEVWGIDKFDVVVGNPPYQEKVGDSKTKSLWNHFVKKSDRILSNCGYISMVHPSGWRSLDGDYKDIQSILKCGLIYLEMHNDSDGQKTFNATTSYDWYCFSKKKVTITKIKDQYGNIVNIDLSRWEFIPNGDFEVFDSLISRDGEERVKILHSFSSYETRKSYMSKTYSEHFKYPCVYTIIKDNTINLFWSNTNQNGHFGIPKVMWSNGMASPPTIDIDGSYGLTQFAYAIVDDISNLENIKRCMENKEFVNTMKLCYMSSGNRFDRKVLSTFKKDFWKVFVGN